MRNIIKNKIKDRLKYCVEWENAINIYFANQAILKRQMINITILDLFLNYY